MRGGGPTDGGEPMQGPGSMTGLGLKSAGGGRCTFGVGGAPEAINTVRGAAGGGGTAIPVPGTAPAPLRATSTFLWSMSSPPNTPSCSSRWGCSPSATITCSEVTSDD